MFYIFYIFLYFIITTTLWFHLVPISLFIITNKWKRNNNLQIPLGILGALIATYISSNGFNYQHIFLQTILYVLAIISITDYTYLLISRFTTLYLIPLLYGASYKNISYTPLAESIIASLILGFIFFILQKTAYYFYKKPALGTGDIDLVMFIGATSGFLGAWFSITIGSLMALLYTGLHVLLYKTKKSKIPFGTFLALASSCYLLLPTQIITFYL